MKDDLARIDELNMLRPARFPFLVKFVLERGISGGCVSDFSLRLRFASLQETHPHLELKFTGIRDLRVGSLEGAFAMLLSVKSVRMDQMEGIAFKVEEEENRAFSFFCSDFSWEVLPQE